MLLSCDTLPLLCFSACCRTQLSLFVPVTRMIVVVYKKMNRVMNVSKIAIPFHISPSLLLFFRPFLPCIYAKECGGRSSTAAALVFSLLYTSMYSPEPNSRMYCMHATDRYPSEAFVLFLGLLVVHGVFFVNVTFRIFVFLSDFWLG